MEIKLLKLYKFFSMAFGSELQFISDCLIVCYLSQWRNECIFLKLLDLFFLTRFAWNSFSALHKKGFIFLLLFVFYFIPKSILETYGWLGCINQGIISFCLRFN